MRIYTKDVKKKVKELKKLFPNLEVYISGRKKFVELNGVTFTFEEIVNLDINKLKHPSFWGV